MSMPAAKSVRPSAASLVWPAVVVAALMPLLAAVPTLLRSDHVLPPSRLWSDWPIGPGITLLLAATVWLYIAGQREIPDSLSGRPGVRHHLAFFGGLAALFIALQSPVEPLSEHLFIAHQIEQMLLRTGAPMLLMLAAPQAALARGLPSGARRMLAPVRSNPVIRALGIFGHPAIATVLFIAISYFWMIPRYNDLTIVDGAARGLWQATLLVSGLVFFWRLLDPRPYPLGASLGARLSMFWFASIANALLGAYLTFKQDVLYQAYDTMGRQWLSPAADERLGGLTIWVPGSMIFAATTMLMIYRWARQEEHAAAQLRDAAAAVPTVAEFVASRRSANRKMAMGLLAFAGTVLLISLAATLTYHYSGSRGGGGF
jgi:putative membrane protein